MLAFNWRCGGAADLTADLPADLPRGLAGRVSGLVACAGGDRHAGLNRHNAAPLVRGTCLTAQGIAELEAGLAVGGAGFALTALKQPGAAATVRRPPMSVSWWRPASMTVSRQWALARTRRVGGRNTLDPAGCP